MIERMLYPALDFWVAQPAVERKKILEALHADAAMSDHDFAGLPPQVQTGVLAGLPPPSPPAEQSAPAKKSSKGHE